MSENLSIDHPAAVPGPPDRPRSRGPQGFWPWVREHLEILGVAFILALLIRHHLVEIFKIPTGSMAVTLLGEHVKTECPRCGWPLRVGAADNETAAHTVTCPNCRLDGIPLPHRGTGGCTQCRRVFRVEEAEPSPGGGLTCPHCGRVGNRPFLAVRGGDKILADKFVYRYWDEPDRWDVVVFRYYDEGQGRYRNFIKRLVGVPGDVVTIEHGDVYNQGVIERKPRDVQDAIWIPLADTRYDWEATHPREYRWQTVLPDGETGWTRAAGGIWLHEGGAGAAPDRLRFDTEDDKGVRIELPYNHGGSIAARIGDLRLDLEATFERGGGVEITLAEDAERYILELAAGARPRWRRIAPGPDGEEPGTLLDSGAVGDPLEAGRTYAIAWYQYDDRLGLEIDGDLLVWKTLEDPVPERFPADETRSGAWLEGTGTRPDRSADPAVRIGRLRLARDIYYEGREAGGYANLREPIALADEQYLFLGDNSSNSQDSRAWNPILAEEGGAEPDRPQGPFIHRDKIVGRAILAIRDLDWPGRASWLDIRMQRVQ